MFAAIVLAASQEKKQPTLIPESSSCRMHRRRSFWRYLTKLKLRSLQLYAIDEEHRPCVFYTPNTKYTYILTSIDAIEAVQQFLA